MDPTERRSTLRSRPNPTPRLDQLVRLDGRVPTKGATLTDPRVTLSYVPDRVVLDPESVAFYLSSLARVSWPGPEELALAVLDDVNNEAVPRWVQARVITQSNGGLEHLAVVEDHQPHWRPSWAGPTRWGDAPGRTKP